MRGGEVGDCAPCLFVCVSFGRCVHLHVGVNRRMCVCAEGVVKGRDMGEGVAGRLQAIFSKMLQLSPRLNSTERLSLIFQSIHYLLCSYSSLSHRQGKKRF